MKELLAELINAEEESDKVDRLWNADPENKELESQWDETYRKEVAAQNALIHAIVNFTSERIDAKKVRLMLSKKRPELESLISRWAGD